VAVRPVALEDVVASVRDETALVAVSAVQSADGRVLDVDALVAAAADHGAEVLLDTTQSCGWLPIDCTAVDYAVCGAYKWLLSPRGTAFLSIRPERMDAVLPHAANWYAGGDIWGSIYGTPLRLADDARRFDISPAWLCWAGAAPSLELMASLDQRAVRQHDVGLADGFLDRLGLPSQGSAIVTVDAPGAEQALAAAGVRTAVRAGRVRLSFHVYNDLADVDLAVTAIEGAATLAR
jgi:selenocysteine lyase/cysteine desulfurase